MANIKSQIKRNRQTEKRRARNRVPMGEMRGRVKVANQAIIDGSDDASAKVDAALKAIDKAAQRNIIHRNKAARDKSRLTKRLTAALADA